MKSMKKLVFSVFLMIPVLSFAQIRIDAGRDTTFCESCVSKGTVVLGSNLKIKNGTPPYTYKWTTKYNLAGRFYEYAKDLLSDSTLSMPIFKSSLPNKIWQPFVVEVKDANQQIARDTINIRFSGFILSASQYMFFQHMGDEVEFNQSNIGGGIPPYRSYSWSPTVGLSSPNVFPTKCRVIGNQIYTLRAVDSVGCVAEDASYDVLVPVAEEPVLGETDSWMTGSYHYSTHDGSQQFDGSRYHYLRGDTILQNKKYKCLYTSDKNFFSKTTASFEGGVREEGKKWYFVYSYDLSTEVLVKDFGVKVGDIINLRMPVIVTRIDAVQIAEGFRKRIELNHGSTFWIEGVGSDSGVLDENIGVTDSYLFLICYHKNDNLVYLRGGNYACNLQDGIESTKQNRELMVMQDGLPNSKIQLKYSGEINTISIYTMQGKLVQQIFPQENNVTISLTNQPKGIYFLRLISPDGIFVKKIIWN
jgi:hypothetical protein